MEWTQWHSYISEKQQILFGPIKIFYVVVWKDFYLTSNIAASNFMKGLQSQAAAKNKQQNDLENATNKSYVVTSYDYIFKKNTHKHNIIFLDAVVCL